jgi:hypothetical protein
MPATCGLAMLVPDILPIVKLAFLGSVVPPKLAEVLKLLMIELPGANTSTLGPIML